MAIVAPIITTSSTRYVTVDQYMDYVPGISTLTNLGDLFLNYVICPFKDSATLEKSHYFTYLETKHWLRCITLLVPFLGNALIVALDIYCTIKAEKLENLAELAMNPSRNQAEQMTKEARKLFHQAWSYGSNEARFQLGKNYLSGLNLRAGLSENKVLKIKKTAKKLIQQAAALKHPEATKMLGCWSDDI